ncbi:hypothetical protein [Vibrio agarivorans]|uniref:Uncharacterized protein n=1 Tax=Vibrio agarivorans TaxID=153622 RepID=A0ABT7Y0F1_9VIBR|nr:hypothetical protein [Vibrio agarivorans]MDN2481500.1 hypothetical protein [Vibrio agarivorans]
MTEIIIDDLVRMLPKDTFNSTDDSFYLDYSEEILFAKQSYYNAYMNSLSVYDDKELQILYDFCESDVGVILSGKLISSNEILSNRLNEASNIINNKLLERSVEIIELD